MEENKKSGVGDVRAKALSWDIEWEKAKNVFFGFFPLTPTVTRDARHSHPSPPEKKVASRKKSRLRRKKTRLPQTHYSIVWKACPHLPHTVRHAVTLNPP
ncbi:MAG: hypothetical protein PUE05_00010 [bacterium]|nr:hypothetical protein [bacterium]